MERLDAFMARANAAYYATRDPFADFTTAPEISQVFGEILGLWAAVTWELLGRPGPVLLVEAGPGRGTLMADALRAVRQKAPPFGTALRLHLIETSPRLRALQAERLPHAAWHASLASVPEGPMILLANEFLDALPIRQFVRRGGGWAERFVADGSFIERRADVVPTNEPLPDGTVIEISEAARGFVSAVAERLARHGGAALFLDYGPEHATPGDSLQALSNGKPADPLASAGEADLTAHVDFAALAEIACSAGAACDGPLPQGIFLNRLGLYARSNRLAERQPPARAAATMQAARRLAEPDAMGRLFKAMALRSRTCPMLPGFADDPPPRRAS